MQIKIQPQDEEEATLMLASNVRHLATADVPAPKVIAPPILPFNIGCACPLCARILTLTTVSFIKAELQCSMVSGAVLRGFLSCIWDQEALDMLRAFCIWLQASIGTHCLALPTFGTCEHSSSCLHATWSLHLISLERFTDAAASPLLARIQHAEMPFPCETQCSLHRWEMMKRKCAWPRPRCSWTA